MGIYYYIEDKDGKNLLDKYDIRPKIDVLIYKFWEECHCLAERVPNKDDNDPLEGQEAKDLMHSLQNGLRQELETINKHVEEAKRFLEIPIEEVEIFYRL